MYEKIHRWVDEEEVESREPEDAPEGSESDLDSSDLVLDKERWRRTFDDG